MRDRTAVDTLRGYFYQFDYSMLSLLQLPSPDCSVAIECIEDIDIRTATEETAVQCKYYAATEYNHSVIKPAVMAMLSHFKMLKVANIPTVKYSLRGHFRAGQNKLTLPIDIVFLKQHLLTYREKKVERRHHDDLGVTDAELSEFSSQLAIDVNAAGFEHQYAEVIKQLRIAQKCTQFAAEYFYYNNALAMIRALSIEPDPTNRAITKKAFLEKIDSSSVLFNEWFVQRKGKKAHLAALRSEYFTDLNQSPFERFFSWKLTLNRSSEVISNTCCTHYQGSGRRRPGAMDNRRSAPISTFTGFLLMSWWR